MQEDIQHHRQHRRPYLQFQDYHLQQVHLHRRRQSPPNLLNQCFFYHRLHRQRV
jgi:hypothetical protein